ncbi:MAG TPA: phosphoribosylamine--glycine ligase [Flavitalea sp.]|nr:phosphoribosylamine--glycine ligase [Flavitalea sp.]
MNFLILGAGGREHAVAWKLAQSALCDALFIAPGNAGTAACGKNIPLPANDFDAIARFCVEEKIDLVFVGPEDPLVNGIADHFLADDAVKHIPVIGPSRQAAQLEGSKAFAKEFMMRHSIPTAAYREFQVGNYDEGLAYLEAHSLPVVLKADGLAAGKGVVICQSHEEAVGEFEQMIRQQKFGDASKKVVVEEFLDGIELSVFILTDGSDYALLPVAKDYKKIYEGDKGPNTGGMGAVSPVSFADAAFMQKVKERIIDPTIKGLKKDNIPYVGFIFFGLINVKGDPLVIEYNCRLGDPETEVVIPRLQNDLGALFLATARGALAQETIKEDKRAACTVMAVSGGYPGDYKKGFAIRGLDQDTGESIVFHAGTLARNGETVTNGGRVCCVTSFGDSVQQAVNRSVEIMGNISFEGMYFRKDIGYEFR